VVITVTLVLVLAVASELIIFASWIMGLFGLSFFVVLINLVLLLYIALGLALEYNNAYELYRHRA